jgi:hypothetical protein
MARHTRTAKTRTREHEDVEELFTFAQHMDAAGIPDSGRTLNGRRIWRVQSA